MFTFKLLLPTGGMVNERTLFYSSKIRVTNEVELCKVMRSVWRQDTHSKSFQDWADELNATGDYEGTFTKEDALDNLASAFHLNINGKVVNVYDFYTKHLPLKETV